MVDVRRSVVWAAFALTIVVAMLAVLSGRTTLGPLLEIDGKYGPYFQLIDRYEYGWPFVYMRREPIVHALPPYVLLLLNCASSMDIVFFSPWHLIIDGVVGALGASCVVSLLGICPWTKNPCVGRRQKRTWVVIAGCGAVAISIVLLNWRQFIAEEHALQAIASTDDPNAEWEGTIEQRFTRQICGPQWLREGLGNDFLRMFDRVVQIETSGGELSHVVTLRHLKTIRLISVSNRQLKELAQLPALEALDMKFASITDDANVTQGESGGAEEPHLCLPPMPTLRGLNLYDTAFRGDGLENIMSVEILELAGTQVGDESIPALMSLKQLKALSLCDTLVTEAGVAMLRKALPHCRIDS